MNKSTIINIVLGAALAVALMRIATLPNAEDAALQAIMNRTSVRAYDPSKTLTEEQIEKLVRAGMSAPSAVNRQPWHFAIVDDRALLRALSAANPNAKPVAEASLAIVVCGDMDKAMSGANREYWVQDASAATENILVAATAMGLGSLWTGTYPNSARCQAVSQVLNLPSNLVPLWTIAVGYAAEEVAPKDKWNISNISRNGFGDASKKAQENVGGFRTFDVRKDFRTNPFNFFKGKGLLLCAGDKDSGIGEMTIGWGALGNIWEKDDAVATVYVSSSRNTFGYMEKAKYFTIMEFDEKDANILQYMGTHSGRDGDKVEATGLTTLFTENGTPYFGEAKTVMECEMIYHAPFDEKGFGEMPKEFYANYSSGMHTMYMGKIVTAMRK